MSLRSLVRSAAFLLGLGAATAMAHVAASEHNTRWSEWFTDVIVSLVGEDGELQVMEEVWHLD